MLMYMYIYSGRSMQCRCRRMGIGMGMGEGDLLPAGCWLMHVKRGCVGGLPRLLGRMGTPRPRPA